MARTAVTILDATRSGAALPQVAADTGNGNYLDNPDRCVLNLNNPTASPIVVTIQYDGTFDGLAVAGRTISVAAFASLFLGNFSPGPHYQDADQGRLYFDSPSASLLVGAVRFPAGL